MSENLFFKSAVPVLRSYVEKLNELIPTDPQSFMAVSGNIWEINAIVAAINSIISDCPTIDRDGTLDQDQKDYLDIIISKKEVRLNESTTLPLNIKFTKDSLRELLTLKLLDVVSYQFFLRGGKELKKTVSAVKRTNKYKLPGDMTDEMIREILSYNNKEYEKLPKEKRSEVMRHKIMENDNRVRLFLTIPEHMEKYTRIVDATEEDDEDIVFMNTGDGIVKMGTDLYPERTRTLTLELMWDSLLNCYLIVNAVWGLDEFYKPYNPSLLDMPAEEVKKSMEFWNKFCITQKTLEDYKELINSEKSSEEAEVTE